MVQDAYATGNFEGIKDILEEQNELGCPLESTTSAFGGDYCPSNTPGKSATQPLLVETHRRGEAVDVSRFVPDFTGTRKLIVQTTASGPRSSEDKNISER